MSFPKVASESAVAAADPDVSHFLSLSQRNRDMMMCVLMMAKMRMQLTSSGWR